MTDLNLVAAYAHKRLTIRRIYRVAFAVSMALLLISILLVPFQAPHTEWVGISIFAPLLVCIAADLYLRRTRCPGCDQRFVGSALIRRNPSQEGDPYISCPRCKPTLTSAAAESGTSRVS
jgi:hypothetical protein